MHEKVTLNKSMFNIHFLSWDISIKYNIVLTYVFRATKMYMNIEWLAMSFGKSVFSFSEVLEVKHSR